MVDSIPVTFLRTEGLGDDRRVVGDLLEHLSFGCRLLTWESRRCLKANASVSRSSPERPDALAVGRCGRALKRVAHLVAAGDRFNEPIACS